MEPIQAEPVWPGARVAVRHRAQDDRSGGGVVEIFLFGSSLAWFPWNLQPPSLLLLVSCRNCTNKYTTIADLDVEYTI